MAHVDSEGAFLAGPDGPLYAIRFSPVGAPPKAAALYFPPFAEEMNRSRRMAALQARALAAAGVEVLVVDPFGTGDSAGDFAEATWERWISSLSAGWDLLERRGHKRVLAWGVRTGALLAADTATRRGGPALHLWWQPVQVGATYLEQFLRLRLAADLVGAGATPPTVASLRALLAADESIEIAGYELSPSLAQALDARTLGTCLGSTAARIAWFEVGAGEPPTMSVAGMRGVEQLRGRGHSVEAVAAQGPAFWAAAETVTAPALIPMTVAAALNMAGE